MQKYFLSFFVLNFLMFSFLSCYKKTKVLKPDKTKVITNNSNQNKFFTKEMLTTKNNELRIILQNGQDLYFKHCVNCHGKEGKGNGKLGLSLNPTPKDESNAKIMKKYPDWFLIKIIKEGGQAVNKSPFMPAYKKKLADKEIKILVRYIKSLAKK